MNGSILNPKNENTEKIIHLLVTTLCNRQCKNCCNHLYAFGDIDYVTDEELRRCHTICLTGGEPFLYSAPDKIAMYYKKRYPNIKKVFVYTNALELAAYLDNNGTLNYIDGVTVSIKNSFDQIAFNRNICSNPQILKLPNNLCYWFEDFKPCNKGNFTIQHREWQPLTEWKPASDSIFRRI